MTAAPLLETHRARWTAKPGLRHYYEHEIFARIARRMAPGRSLEIGTGPGFLARHLAGRELVSLDIAPAASADVLGDVHALPFADATFDNAIGVDCLHHFARPALALREIARTLKPAGRLVLIEPWAGPIGWLFYRYLHHEDCEAPADAFSLDAPGPKDAMAGNAALPRAIFVDDPERLSRAVPGLGRVEAEYFGALSYLATGGFQAWGLPRTVIAALISLERLIPRVARRPVCLRALFVAEKTVS